MANTKARDRHNQLVEITSHVALLRDTLDSIKLGDIRNGDVRVFVNISMDLAEIHAGLVALVGTNGTTLAPE